MRSVSGKNAGSLERDANDFLQGQIYRILLRKCVEKKQYNFIHTGAEEQYPMVDVRVSGDYSPLGLEDLRFLGLPDSQWALGGVRGDGSCSHGCRVVAKRKVFGEGQAGSRNQDLGSETTARSQGIIFPSRNDGIISINTILN